MIVAFHEDDSSWFTSKNKTVLREQLLSYAYKERIKIAFTEAVKIGSNACNLKLTDDDIRVLVEEIIAHSIQLKKFRLASFPHFLAMFKHILCQNNQLNLLFNDESLHDTFVTNFSNLINSLLIKEFELEVFDLSFDHTSDRCFDRKQVLYQLHHFEAFIPEKASRPQSDGAINTA